MENDTSIGDTIRVLRKARGLSREKLSELVGISESHLNKIEGGTRQPGIHTYQKIMEVLGMDIVMRNEDKTVKEKCATKVQAILQNSTEKQAVYLTKVLECMYQNFIK